MRATVSGMHPVLRMAMGVFTVVAFGFFGMTFLEGKPLVGWALLAFAGLRAVLLVREAWYYFTPYPDEE